MFRPITRRWGICFRSTQRYTVWVLTPRNFAASLTVNGHSSAQPNLGLSRSSELCEGSCICRAGICVAEEQNSLFESQ